MKPPIITPNLLRAILPEVSPEVVLKAAPALQRAAVEYEIQTAQRIALFLGNLAEESGYRPREEDLYYTAPRLMRIWPNRFPTYGAALPYAANPQKLANTVYADRLGNGPPASGDGWRFRGRGLGQTTGRANYATYSPDGFDLVAQPELLLQFGVSALSAAKHWAVRGGNTRADRGDVTGTRLVVNGGLIGIERVRLYCRRALAALGR